MQIARIHFNMAQLNARLLTQVMREVCRDF